MRILGFKIIRGSSYDRMCEIINRMIRGNGFTERIDYYRRTIEELQGMLRYAESKYPDLKKDFERPKQEIFIPFVL